MRQEQSALTNLQEQTKLLETKISELTINEYRKLAIERNSVCAYAGGQKRILSF